MGERAIEREREHMGLLVQGKKSDKESGRERKRDGERPAYVFHGDL